MGGHEEYVLRTRLACEAAGITLTPGGTLSVMRSTVWDEAKHPRVPRGPGGGQFSRKPKRLLVLPDLGHTGKTVTVRVPEVPEGHTRIYRLTNGGSAEGWYADRPLTGWGETLFHVDVPTGELPKYAASESGGKGTYRHPGTGAVKMQPLGEPGHGTKPYEMADWKVYPHGPAATGDARHARRLAAARKQVRQAETAMAAQRWLSDAWKAAGRKLAAAQEQLARVELETA